MRQYVMHLCALQEEGWGPRREDTADRESVNELEKFLQGFKGFKGAS